MADNLSHNNTHPNTNINNDNNNNDDTASQLPPELPQPTDPDPDTDPDEEQGANSSDPDDGRWGEQDPGEPVSRRAALEDLDDMRRELTRLSTRMSGRMSSRQRSRSRSRPRSVASTHPAAASATGTRKHGRSSAFLSSPSSTSSDDEQESAEEKAEEAFDLGDFLRGGHLERRTTAGEPSKKISVVFKNLSVQGVAPDAGASFVRTLPDAVLGTFGPDLYHLVVNRLLPANLHRRLAGFFRTTKNHAPSSPPVRGLIHDFTGAVREGEMMLVLGRPGAGCSTFLKTIANDRGAFAGVSGQVEYGGIPDDEQRRRFRGEVVYNPEDDQHFPSLTVGQTLRFSLLNKTRRRDRAGIPVIVDAFLKMFGIAHTKHTAVGNAFVRGVSGGERKRVSIAEALSTKASVVCWDNSTRGLDASTALDYARSLRIMTDVNRRATLVTLYQAGESIYELMDKVLVVDAGRMLYLGPADQARQYFIDLGFYCPEKSTTADFLTSLCDPNSRQFQPGREASTPKTPEEIESRFRQSDAYRAVLEETTTGFEQQEHDTQRFQRTVAQSKSKTVSQRSSYTVSLPRQVAACVRREFWLLWGDKTSLYTKCFIILSNALIVSSLFYGESFDTSGAFARSGALFFSVLFLGWLQLTELMPAVSGRTVVARHQAYAFYRPSAVSIARVVVDFPVILAMVVPFTVIVYFMTQLDPTPSKFFIYFLFVYTTTFSITSLYRMFAALSPTIDDAVRFAGISLNLLLIFIGYVIPKQALVSGSIWFGWLFYVNPISYSYEAVMANEFSDRTMACSPSQLVPNGPGVDPDYQACSLTGSQFGSTDISGSRYLQETFQFTRSHLWRNFGVVVAFTVLYILVTVIAAETLSFVGQGGGALVFKKSRRTKKASVEAKKASSNDEEKALSPTDNASAAVANGEALRSPDENDGAGATTFNNSNNRLSASDRVFTWSNVEYSVPYGNGTRKLLNGVSGYAKPGLMIALMGASGAGKTTLLNTLAQRQKIGVVSGAMEVDGQPLGPEFQRGTGFCEQMDLHDNTATIREALEFSAILRQHRDIPRKEKVDYVNHIIDLLELDNIQDAIISSLSVEQKKRVTIGVELAAKPSLLLFLDEPTSGLDSQAAMSIVRFLKKLARAGQAIVCTIHQPSSMLIQQYDMILALNPGGNTFYFGPVGENGSAAVKYFADRGVVCPPKKNVAEFILETAAKARTRNDGTQIDWNEEWKHSVQNRELMDEISRIREERRQVPRRPDDKSRKEYEFAAPTSLQTIMLTKRLFTSYWRDPSYYYGKLFVSVILGIFNGFTFWMLGNSIASMQNRMFSSFLIVLLPPILINSIVPKFYMNRALWEAREYPSRIYGWVAFGTANIVCEVPAAIVTAVIYWALWYFPVGFPASDSSTAGYVFLMSMLFFLFQASWGQWICAFAPSFTVISNVLPFFFVMVSLFNGIVRPYRDYPVFWKYWMYYVNPVTWWLRGVLSAVLPGVDIFCTPAETTHFDPPPGQTCGEYAGYFVDTLAQTGYLVDNAATSDCQYCQFRDGREYMHTLNVLDDDKWRCFGIFLAFVVINWLLVYFFLFTVRVKGWSFGMGYLFSGAEKVISAIKGGFKRVISAEKKPDAEKA